MPGTTPSMRARLMTCGLLLSSASLLSCGNADGTGDGHVNPIQEFGIVANNAFFYYDDLAAATGFYTETLGLAVAADYGFAKIIHVAPTSYLTLVDADSGMHSADEPKTVALALVTDELDEWYSYLKAREVELRYGYDPVAGRPHHGFVVVDPEGYYLEFERFNPHPENELLLPELERSETLATAAPVNETLGFKATILWLYYKDLAGIQRFYEEKLGLSLIVDQGWAKIYRTSGSGYLGLVDETRGMHSYTERKAVTVSFFTTDVAGWFEYARQQAAFELRSDSLEQTDRYRAFVGYDPEGYYLEFDTFLTHQDNATLVPALQGGR